MKILLINKFLFPKGGDAICALETGKLLKSKGHAVTYWGMKSSKNPDYPHQDLFIDEVDFETKSGFSRQLRLAGNLLYSTEAKTKIEQLLQRDGKPDLVHLHNFAHQISPSVLDVFKKYKIPCVMTMHDFKLVCASYTLLSKDKPCEKCSQGKHYHCFLEGCVKGSRFKSFLNTMEMYLHHQVLRIYDHIHTFIAPSLFMKTKLAAMGFKRPVVHIPNFIDVAQFASQSQSRERSICYVGRLSKEKGVEDLINAVRGLEVVLKIIGDGPQKDQLRALASSLGMNQVRFLGYKTGDDLKNEIRNAAFTVVPSRCYENNPRVVIEAFALGKPVIGTRTGGIPELVRDGTTGLTFRFGDREDLRTKIISLLQSPEQSIVRMGENARTWVTNELNAETHYARLIKIYNTLLR